MLFETLIIVAYFFGLMVPVGTVVLFFRLDSQGKLEQLSGFDSYQLPDEDPVKLLPPAEPRSPISNPIRSKTRCDAPERR